MKIKKTTPYPLTGAIAYAAVAMASAGSAQNLFVENWYDPGAIYDITPAGSTSTFVAGGMGEPLGMAFDPSGNLFVADALFGDIYEFTPNGTMTTFATGLINPDNLAFNAAGDLFVCDNRADNIYEYRPNGMRSTFATGLSNPTGLAFNGAGDLFVAN